MGLRVLRVSWDLELQQVRRNDMRRLQGPKRRRRMPGRQRTCGTTSTWTGNQIAAVAAVQQHGGTWAVLLPRDVSYPLRLP
jgi:hypothetical protein